MGGNMTGLARKLAISKLFQMEMNTRLYLRLMDITTV